MAKFQKQSASSRYYAVGNVVYTDKTTNRRAEAKDGSVIDPTDADFESLMRYGAITDKCANPRIDVTDVAGDEGLSEL